jgi:hypothetical protein
MLSFVGATLAGVGTLFIALTLGASFLALRAQSEQLILQQQELSESRAQLKEAADIQAKTLANLERQAQSALLTAEIHGLASRLEGYEAQIKMVVTTTGYNTTNLAERNDGVPTYQVEDEEGRTHLLIQLPVEEDEDRSCLWRPDHAGFDSRSIFEGALVEE